MQFNIGGKKRELLKVQVFPDTMYDTFLNDHLNKHDMNS